LNTLYFTTIATPNKKRHELSLYSKIELIRASVTGKSQRRLAVLFKCPKSTVQKILSKRRDYETAFKQNMNGSRKRVKCTSPNEELNTVLWDWYAKITSSNVPASGPLIQDKISQLAVKLNNNKFKASNGWLYRFCQRHDIRQITFQREGGVDKHIVDSFKALFPI